MSLSLEHINDRNPVLFIAIGRQQAGKTTFLNTTAQYLKERGGTFQIWNADLLNKTHGLKLFHDETIEAPSLTRDDVKAWLQGKIKEQARERFDAVLDFGCGDKPLESLIEAVPEIATLQQQGIRVVVAHLIGPRLHDAKYLDGFSQPSTLTPDGTLIVCNGGVVPENRDEKLAFQEIMRHGAIEAALLKGALVQLFPRFSLMLDVTERELTFNEAMNGVEGQDGRAFGLVDRARVEKWWIHLVPDFFQEVPTEWLPSVQRN